MVEAIKVKLLQNANEFRYMYFGIVLTILVILLYSFFRDIYREIKSKNDVKNKLKRIFQNKFFLGMIVTVIPIILEIVVYKNYRVEFYTEVYYRIAYAYSFFALLYIYIFLLKKIQIVNQILDFVVKHRYKIACAVFVILVLFKVNFSSIGMWDAYIREGVNSTFLGQPRAIRSDEWLVTTPFSLSQQYDGYKLINDKLGLGNNDMNIYHGPVLDISIIVRIFYWGYILFGNEYGLSWYWVLKFIVIFMSFFELGMILTKKDKGMALLLAVWVTFSPSIMWWSMWDTPAFAAAIIVLFHVFVANKDLSLKKKLLIAYGMIVFLCQFAYALYPAWQIPLAYLMLIFIVVDFIKYRKNLALKDYIIMGITLLITILFLGYFAITSWEGIVNIMSTKYPGAREATGGGYDFQRLINYYTNFFTPYTDDYANSSELAGFIYPSLAVIIVCLYQIVKTIKNKNIKEKLKDKDNWYVYGIFILLLVFLSWMSFKWPTFLRKITLFYMSEIIRTETIFEFSCVLFTVLVAEKWFNKDEDKGINKKISFIVSFCIAVLTYYVALNSRYGDTFSTFKFSVLIPIIFFMNYTFISKNKKAFIYVMIIISLLVGGYVNPINIGTDSITKTEIAQTAIEIAKEDPDAIWIGGSQINAQYLIANGLKVLNGINEYPNYDWIDVIDSEHVYEEVWNRYAHITIVLSDTTEFKLVTPDSYILYLNYDDLKKINIEYYYTNEKASEEKIQEFALENLYENDITGQYIYRIN